MKTRSENKKIFLFTLIGSIIMLLAVIGAGAIGVTPHARYLMVSIQKYGSLWVPATKMGTVAFVCCAFLYLNVAVLICNVLFALFKKQPIRICTAVCLFLAVAFLPFLAIYIRPNLSEKNTDFLGVFILALVAVANLLAVLLLGIAMYRSFAEPYVQQVQEAAPRRVEPEERGLNEEEVRKIVEEYLAAHREESHSTIVEEPVEEIKEEPVEEEPAPVKEEPQEEEVLDDDEDEEEEEEEEVEVVDDNGQVLKIKRKKKVHFETRLRNSEFDLRHKYYDLRDYLKWYGLNNRISIPGDTFSLKRKKYAFITIQGKHIKFYASIDPAKYEDSPIPVERATAKRFVDTPCMLRIKSDLSYRRAKLIVDDMMKEAGFNKPEGDEPKETQHPEEK